MKTLITSTIKIKGVGPQDTKTIFDIITPNILPENPTSEEIELHKQNEFYNENVYKNGDYKSLLSLKKRKIIISFDFMDDNIITNSKIFYVIPELSNDEDIKENIILAVQDSLK